MLKLKKIIIFIWLSLIIGTISVNLSAQNVPDNFAKTQDNFVKWQMLSGKDSEFFFAVPANSTIYTDQNFYLDRNRYARVDYVKTLVSQLGNTVMQVSLYDGAAKEVQKILVDDVKEEIKFRKLDEKNILQINEAEKNGFQTLDMTLNYPAHFSRKQFFRNQDRLYVLTTVSRQAKDQVVKDFLESVRLVNKGKVLSPNLSDRTEELSAAKMTLPKAFAEKLSATEVSDAIAEEATLDKQVVVVYQPSPRLVEINSKFDRTFNQLKIKVLFLENGKVGAVETVTKTSRAMEKQVIEAAKEIRFLPAERNGKTVSTYGTIIFSLTIN